MSGFYGADTEQLGELADQMRGGRARLEDLASQVISQALSVEWEGPDADSFRTDVTGRVRGLFDSANGLLDSRAGEVESHADEQDAASEGEGGFLESIGDAIGGVIDGALGIGRSIGQGIWDVLNHPLVSGGMGLLGTGLGLVENLVKDMPKLTGAASVLGKVLAPISIATGVNSMFNPEHDGWRGVGDRIAGGLSVVSGVAAFVPGPGWIVSGVAGGISALWSAGNWVADNWDGITDTVSGAIDGVTDFASDAIDGAKDFASDAVDTVTDTMGGIADGVSDFVGGLF